MVIAYMKPAQAAFTSIEGATAPNRSCSRQAVEGVGWSGVIVATKIRSTSPASHPDCSKHRTAAS